MKDHNQRKVIVSVWLYPYTEVNRHDVGEGVVTVMRHCVTKPLQLIL
jgi:hypothetical protein